MKKISAISIVGQIGFCGKVEAFLGFAPANLLYTTSFADIINDVTGEGYQCPRNVAHSRSFRQYIKQPNTSTIPLTFNLRRELSHTWSITRQKNGRAVLHLCPSAQCLSQIDCQHRLSELKNDSIPLAFMAYIGLDLRTEMAIFTVINSKAKGLISSLTDYHESDLIPDLANEIPHLYIAKKLNEDTKSPWYRLIKYGGDSTSGLKRRTSLRMMQKCIQKLIRYTAPLSIYDINDLYHLIVIFWNTVRTIFQKEWADPRHSLLTKGIGLYSLMYLLSELVVNAPEKVHWEMYFFNKIMCLKNQIDWSSKGSFSNYSGQKGAIEVYHILKKMLDL